MTLTVLAVGATGSIGRHVVAEAVAAGHTIRALVRNPARAALPAGVEVVAGTSLAPKPSPRPWPAPTRLRHAGGEESRSRMGQLGR